MVVQDAEDTDNRFDEILGLIGVEAFDTLAVEAFDTLAVDAFYTLIEEKKRALSFDTDIETHLDRFFLIGKKSKTFTIISFNTIINKCAIKMNSDLDEIFISREAVLKEHS